MDLPIEPLVGELNDFARSIFWRVFTNRYGLKKIPRPLWSEVEEILGDYLEGDPDVSLVDVKRALETLLRELGIKEWKSEAEKLFEDFRLELKRQLEEKIIEEESTSKEFKPRFVKR